MDADYVIMALGSNTEKTLLEKMGVKLDDKGYVQVDECNQTNITGVFAAGNITGDKTSVSAASRSGRDTAISISKYLDNL